MKEEKNIVRSVNYGTKKYSSNSIERGLLLAESIKKYSNYYKQINELLEEAKALYNLKPYHGVLTCSEKVIKINESCAEAYWYKSRALWKMFDSEDALTTINKAICLKHNFAEALLTKSAILIDLDKYSEAIKAAEEVINIKPDE